MYLAIEYLISGGLQLLAMALDDLYCRKFYKDPWSWFSWTDLKESFIAFNDNINAMFE